MPKLPKYLNVTGLTKFRPEQACIRACQWVLETTGGACCCSDLFSGCLLRAVLFRKLPSSTGNLHGWLAEAGLTLVSSEPPPPTLFFLHVSAKDYSQINWPLPKMFGKEKYGYRSSADVIITANVLEAVPCTNWQCAYMCM